MKNKKVRIAMMQAGITQSTLATILDIPLSEVSVMLKYELAVKEQNSIASTIKEWAASNNA